MYILSYLHVFSQNPYNIALTYDKCDSEKTEFEKFTDFYNAESVPETSNPSSGHESGHSAGHNKNS